MLLETLFVIKRSLDVACRTEVQNPPYPTNTLPVCRIQDHCRIPFCKILQIANIRSGQVFLEGNPVQWSGLLGLALGRPSCLGWALGRVFVVQLSSRVPEGS